MSENIGFGFDENTKEGSPGKFIQITPETAIAEGRYIDKLEFVEGNNPYFKVTVKNAQGQTAQKFWFEPKKDEMYTKTDADLKKKVTQFNGVMANLTRRFLGENYKPERVTTFESLCKIVIKDIGNKYEGKELRIKCVYDKNGFPSLPNVAPIFEDLVTNPSKLIINPKYDNVISSYKPRNNDSTDAATELTPDTDPLHKSDTKEANF